MDEYKSRLSTFLSDMIREELEKYDGGYTDEWNDQRKENAEVLGYKLAGTSDIKEELQNSQGEQTDFKKGDLVKDINPDCPHHGSEGKVTKVGKGTITFDVSNNGKNYQQGDELEKTVDQMVKLKESIDEKISKEEWSQYPAYARKLKPYMQRLLKVRLKVRVIKQANHNPWIEIRVARFGKDIIPNDFRKKAFKVIGGRNARDMDNINYGNIRTNSISMKHDQWVKLLGNKVKESVIKEGGMGILDTDQADVLQAIVMRNKNKSTKSILSVALKSGYFKGVDKKELLGYIDGARQFVKYMKSHPMESVNEDRDYKAEYKKYGSSTKAKKYRAELNQYNRKKGTYGNNDGKDASHKGGKIVGFEKESTNRGRREKSRLKKEDIREFSGEQGINVYLGGIVDAMRKAGLKAKTAKQMKHGFSKSKDKIGFFIDVEQRGFDRKEMYTLQVEIDRDGNLWYLSGHRPMKLGKWADTSKIVRMWKALNKVKAFGQDAIFKKR